MRAIPRHHVVAMSQTIMTLIETPQHEIVVMNADEEVEEAAVMNIANVALPAVDAAKLHQDLEALDRNGLTMILPLPKEVSKVEPEYILARLLNSVLTSYSS